MAVTQAEYRKLLERERGRAAGPQTSRDDAVRRANIAAGFGNSTAERFLGGPYKLAPKGSGKGGGGRGKGGGGGGGSVPTPTPRPGDYPEAATGVTQPSPIPPVAATGVTQPSPIPPVAATGVTQRSPDPLASLFLPRAGERAGTGFPLQPGYGTPGYGIGGSWPGLFDLLPAIGGWG